MAALAVTAVRGASVAEARPGAGQRYRVGGGLARVRTGCNGWARISQRETNLAMLASVCAGMTPALRMTEIMVPGGRSRLVAAPLTCRFLPPRLEQ